jgi:hypothetical protein
MSAAIQQKGLAAQLFSSALFCLWLSTASLVVWVDLGATPTGRSVQAHAPDSAPAASVPAVPVQPNTATPAGADAA